MPKLDQMVEGSPFGQEVSKVLGALSVCWPSAAPPRDLWAEFESSAVLGLVDELRVGGFHVVLGLAAEILVLGASGCITRKLLQTLCKQNEVD